MMRRFGALLVIALLLIPLPALAHDFTGGGDCEGWTLVLDGLYGATNITIDGASVPLQLSHEIGDTSAATSRSFVVFWDKPSNDVTVTHTLYRQGECTPTTTQPTTTTTEVTTTTQPEVTTTTQPTTTTTPNVTTTTQPTTTETQPPATTTTRQECPPGTVHQPPLCVTTTVPFFDTTTTAVVLASSTRETLPFTGADTSAMAGLGVSLAAAGALILLGTRSRKVEG